MIYFLSALLIHTLGSIGLLVFIFTLIRDKVHKDVFGIMMYIVAIVLLFAEGYIFAELLRSFPIVC